jgi:UTP--glucose-1-phosphate uridylyltransferase
MNAGLLIHTVNAYTSIAQHFQPVADLEHELAEKNKLDLLKSLRLLTRKDITWTSVYQQQPLGLGHAVLCARDAVGDEPFAVILPDDLIDDGQRGCLKQMIDVYERYHSGVIAAETVTRNGQIRMSVSRPGDREPDYRHCGKAQAGGSTIHACCRGPVYPAALYFWIIRAGQERSGW